MLYIASLGNCNECNSILKCSYILKTAILPVQCINCPYMRMGVWLVALITWLHSVSVVATEDGGVVSCLGCVAVVWEAGLVTGKWTGILKLTSLRN